METKMTDQLLDEAACDALGINTPAESAAYQQELTTAGADARRTDQMLRETVSRLAAASPHLMPSADLRGRILQATAPTTFKMEDYRKATRDNGKFYRWGFYAAMLFLTLGAGYNMMMQSKLKHTEEVATAKLNEAQKIVNNITALDHKRVEAFTAFFGDDVQQITFKGTNGAVQGRAWLNEEKKQALVVLPSGMIPKEGTLQLTQPGPNGTAVAFDTLVLKANEAPGAGVPEHVTPMKITDLRPDVNAKPLIAGFNITGQ